MPSQTFKDEPTRTIITLHGSVSELTDYACQGKQGIPYDDSEWIGRSLHNWTDVRRAFNEPWKEGSDTVNRMVSDIRKAKLPEPKSIKRRGEWSDIEGEVCTDRLMTGEPEFYRNVRRQQRSAIRTVAVMCNVSDHCGIHHKDIFWKGAAAIAAVDLLEAAGYSCEVWGWFNCTQGFGGGWYGRSNVSHPNYFTAYKLKEAGNEVDLDTLTKGMSGWFFRTAGLGGLQRAGEIVSQNPSDGMGYPVHKMPKEMRAHVDVEHGIYELIMPSVRNERDAIQAAHSMLGTLNEQVEAQYV